MSFGASIRERGRLPRMLGLAGAVLAIASAAPGGAGIPDGEPRFETDVLPILEANCVSCHGRGARQAELDLRTRAGLLRGGRRVLRPRDQERAGFWEGLGAEVRSQSARRGDHE